MFFFTFSIQLTDYWYLSTFPSGVFISQSGPEKFLWSVLQYFFCHQWRRSSFVLVLISISGIRKNRGVSGMGSEETGGEIIWLLAHNWRIDKGELISGCLATTLVSFWNYFLVTVVKRFCSSRGWLFELEAKILNARLHWNRKKQWASPWPWTQTAVLVFGCGDFLPTRRDDWTFVSMPFRWKFFPVPRKILFHCRFRKLRMQ